MAFLMVVGITNAQNTKMMKKKVLFVLTSHSEKGNTGEKTGYYLSEVSHPWEVLFDAGYEIDFVSPLGGKAPVDGFDLTDAVNKKFWENSEYRHKVENTMKPSEVMVNEYAAIFFAGGHGTMWDLPDNDELQNIAAQIYEADGVVGAVCHGPSGLVNIKLSDINKNECSISFVCDRVRRGRCRVQWGRPCEAFGFQCRGCGYGGVAELDEEFE